MEDVNSWEKAIHEYLENSATMNNNDSTVFTHIQFYVFNDTYDQFSTLSIKKIINRQNESQPVQRNADINEYWGCKKNIDLNHYCVSFNTFYKI